MRFEGQNVEVSSLICALSSVSVFKADYAIHF